VSKLLILSKMEDSAAVKSMKLPVFDRTAKKFQIEWARSMTYACVFGLSHALCSVEETDVPASESVTAPDADEGRKEAEDNTESVPHAASDGLICSQNNCL
jgi:hypothetical protein